jgi:hypothetical protein
LSFPGCDFAAAMNSLRVLTLSFGSTTRTLGLAATTVIGASSLNGSYSIFCRSTVLTARGPGIEMPIV